jgi:hypothetical protein
VDAVARDGDWLEPEAEDVDADLGPDTHGDADLGDDAGEVDEDDVAVGEPHYGSPTWPPGKVDSWRKRSATGAILSGIALGLQQVFEKEREEPAIVQTTSGDPPKDLPVEAEVEHGRPRRSVVNIRPWLLERRGGGPAPTPGAGPDTAPGGADAEADARTRLDQPPAGSAPEGD